MAITVSHKGTPQEKFPTSVPNIWYDLIFYYIVVKYFVNTELHRSYLCSTTQISATPFFRSKKNHFINKVHQFLGQKKKDGSLDRARPS